MSVFVLFFSLFIKAQVGIGTTSPDGSSVLDIDSNSSGVLIPRLTNLQMNNIVNPAEGLVVYNKTSDSFWYYNLATTAWEELGDNLGNHIAEQNLEMTGNWISNDGDNEGVFVRNNGNVGVNLSTPTNVLHINAINSGVKVESPGTSPLGSAISMVSSVGNPVIRYQLGDGVGGVIQTWDVRVDDATSDFVIRDVTTGQDMFEIQSVTGRVDIGTPADGSSLRANTLSLYQNWDIELDGTNNFVVYDNGTPTLTIKRPSGDIDVGTMGDGSILRANSYMDYSDVNIKKNINLIEEPIEKLNALNGYTYNLKNVVDKKLYAGVMAQEVEKIIPSAVHTDENGLKSVAYNRLIPLLIEAVKEQQKEIELLKKKVSNEK